MVEPKLNFAERMLAGWMRLSYTLAPIVLLALFGGAGYAIYTASQNLEINTDSTEMLDSDLPFRQAQIRLKEAFPHLSNTILVLVEADTPDEADIFTKDFVARLSAQTDAVEDVYAPTVDPFFTDNGLLFLDQDELEDVLTRLVKAAPLLAELGEAPTADRLFQSLAENALLAEQAEISSDMLERVYDRLAHVIEARLAGTPEPLPWQPLFYEEDDEGPYRRVVNVTPRLDYERLQPAKAALTAIRIAVDESIAEGGFRVEVGVTGDPALRAEELASVTQGVGLSTVISLIIVALLLILALRSLYFVFASLMALLITLSLTAGFAATTIGALNLVSIAFTVLLIGLGIDFIIHLTLHFQNNRLNGVPANEAFTRCAREIGIALALSAPTTALAFFAFVPTQFVGMAQLGIISGVGVVIALFVTLTLMPAMARFAPPAKVRKQEGPVVVDGVSREGALFSFDFARRRLATVTILLALGAVAVLPATRFDADPMNLRDPDSASVRTFNKLFDDVMTAPYRLHVLTPTLEEAEAAADRLKQLLEVDRTITLASFVPDNQQSKLDMIDFEGASVALALDGTTALALPDIGEGEGLTAFVSALEAEPAGSPGANLRAQLLALEAERETSAELLDALGEDLFRYWPFQLERLRAQLEPNFVTLETIPTALQTRFMSTSGEYRVEVTPALDLTDTNSRRRFVSVITSAEPSASGSARAVLEAGDAVSLAMMQATGAAVLAVAILLMLFLRDAVMVSLIMIPLLLAAILTTATGAIIGQPYNFANVIVLPLLIGLGVDGGLHLALRLKDIEKASHVYATTTPKAVFYSAATTIAAFGTLSFSAHRGTASMGLLLMIALAYVLVATIVVLPVAVQALRRYASSRPSRPEA